MSEKEEKLIKVYVHPEKNIEKVLVGVDDKVAALKPEDAFWVAMRIIEASFECRGVKAKISMMPGIKIPALTGDN